MELVNERWTAEQRRLEADLHKRCPALLQSDHLNRPGFDFRSGTPEDFSAGPYIKLKDPSQAKMLYGSQRLADEAVAQLVAAGYGDAHVIAPEGEAKQNFWDVRWTWPEMVPSAE